MDWSLAPTSLRWPSDTARTEEHNVAHDISPDGPSIRPQTASQSRREFVSAELPNVWGRINGPWREVTGNIAITTALCS